ncbi:MAG: hypothetical protein WC901_00190 [Candidatus Margulisiibacteriota bacterium]
MKVQGCMGNHSVGLQFLRGETPYQVLHWAAGRNRGGKPMAMQETGRQALLLRPLNPKDRGTGTDYVYLYAVFSPAGIHSIQEVQFGFPLGYQGRRSCESLIPLAISTLLKQATVNSPSNILFCDPANPLSPERFYFIDKGVSVYLGVRPGFPGLDYSVLLIGERLFPSAGEPRFAGMFLFFNLSAEAVNASPDITEEAVAKQLLHTCPNVNDFPATSYIAQLREQEVNYQDVIAQLNRPENRVNLWPTHRREDIIAVFQSQVLGDMTSAYSTEACLHGLVKAWQHVICNLFARISGAEYHLENNPTEAKTRELNERIAAVLVQLQIIETLFFYYPDAIPKIGA